MPVPDSTTSPKKVYEEKLHQKERANSPHEDENKDTRLDMAAISREYEKSKGWREVGKWVFSIATLGFGALWLWATTTVIKEGEIGLRSNFRGKMILLPPGRHSNFPWESYPVEPKSLSQPRIALGPYTIFTVETGSIAVTCNQGINEYYKEGQHILESASHILKSFVSLKQQTKKLTRVTNLTRDSVSIALDADVRYQIIDSKLAFAQIEDIDHTVQEIAKICMQKVISRHHLGDFNIGSIANLEAKAEPRAQQTQGSSTEQVIEELTAEINQKLESLGVLLISIGITDRTIVDSNLAHELGQGAVIKTRTECQSLVAQQAARQLIIEAEAKAKAVTLMATADAEAVAIVGAAITQLGTACKGNPAAQVFYTQLLTNKMVENAKSPNLFFGGAPQPVVTLPVQPAHAIELNIQSS